MCQWQRIWLFTAVALGLMPVFVQASRLDDLVAALAGDDEQKTVEQHLRVSKPFALDLAA